MIESTEHFDEHAKVELLGHSVFIARVTRSSLGDLLRCDCLRPDGSTAFTKLISPKAVYAINIISRDLALELTKIFTFEPPVQSYQLPPRQLPSAASIDPADDSPPEGWNGDGR